MDIKVSIALQDDEVLERFGDNWLSAQANRLIEEALKPGYPWEWDQEEQVEWQVVRNRPRGLIAVLKKKGNDFTVGFGWDAKHAHDGQNRIGPIPSSN